MSEHILNYLGNQNQITDATGGAAVAGQNFLAVSGTSPVITVAANLHESARQISVGDWAGQAATANIVVSGVGAATINGASTYTLDANYEVVTLVNSGTSSWVALNTQS